MATALDVVDRTESLVLFGGMALFLYWFMTSDSTQAIRDSISAAIPKGVNLTTPPAPGTEVPTAGGKIGTTSDGNTTYHVATGSGTISVFINGAVQDFGPSAQVPGTGQTVGDLRRQGMSDSDIAYLIDQGSALPQ